MNIGDLEGLLNKTLNQMTAGLTNDNPSRRFPSGLRWRYYRPKKRAHFKDWMCSYSTTRNANYKFCSWAYMSEKGVYRMLLFREHKRRRAAKARAHQLYVDRNQYLEERNAAHSQE